MIVFLGNVWISKVMILKTMSRPKSSSILSVDLNEIVSVFTTDSIAKLPVSRSMIALQADILTYCLIKYEHYKRSTRRVTKCCYLQNQLFCYLIKKKKSPFLEYYQNRFNGFAEMNFQIRIFCCLNPWTKHKTQNRKFLKNEWKHFSK